MSKLAAVLMLALLVSVPFVRADDSAEPRENRAKDSAVPREVSGLDFAVIQAALPAALARAPWMKIKQYRISVYDHGNLYVVIFDPLERPRGTLGSGERPSVEVALSRDSLQVVQTGYSR